MSNGKIIMSKSAPDMYLIYHTSPTTDMRFFVAEIDKSGGNPPLGEQITI